MHAYMLKLYEKDTLAEVLSVKVAKYLGMPIL